MSTYGPRRTDGDYQGPRTDSAQIERGRALRADIWTIGDTHITLQIIPLTGGRPDLYEVALMTNNGRATVYVPCMLRGRELADRAYQLTANRLDAGKIPDVVILPPGAPLGW